MYLIPFFVQYIMFEAFRGMGHVYTSRAPLYRRQRTGAAPPDERPRFPLAWVWPVLSVEDDRLLKLAGLDQFVMVRYIKLCWKICAFATVVCLAILVPVYAGDGDESNNCTIEGQWPAQRSLCRPTRRRPTRSPLTMPSAHALTLIPRVGSR